MKMKVFTIAILILIIAVLTAGCIQLKSGQKQEAQAVTNNTPENQLVEENTTAPAETPQCAADADCTDDDYCTTDACISGECQNQQITDCRSKKTSTPTITEVQLGDKEYIKITANNSRVEKWTIESQNGTVFYTFDRDYAMINNYLTIHTGRGLATTMEWYLMREDFWNVGDTVILKNAKGEIISQMQG